MCVYMYVILVYTDRLMTCYRCQEVTVYLSHFVNKVNVGHGCPLPQLWTTWSAIALGLVMQLSRIICDQSTMHPNYINLSKFSKIERKKIEE